MGMVSAIKALSWAVHVGGKEKALWDATPAMASGRQSILFL